MFGSSLLCLLAVAQPSPVDALWDKEKLFAVPQHEKSDRAAVDGFMSLEYEGLPYKGKPAKVFAYYRAPQGPVPEGGWPAVVCIHGGGGTAFYEWVQYWVDHGYAAISMDLVGRYPHAAPLARNRPPRPRMPDGSPSREGVFDDCMAPVDQQWCYHAVAEVVRAHSLLRSFPEVNAEKTGVTGISWGGILTSIVVGVDPRFKFAVPVYGCGYLSGSDGRMGEALGRYSSEKRTTYERLWEPSNFLPHSKMPILWVNGTNDAHFPIPAWQQSALTAKGPMYLRLEVRMPHGHGVGWQREDIYRFADTILAGKPYPTLQTPMLNGDSLTSKMSVTAVSATLCFTADDNQWSQRKWEQKPASVSGDMIQAALPPQATVAYFTATDANGILVSSPVVQRDADRKLSVVVLKRP